MKKFQIYVAKITKNYEDPHVPKQNSPRGLYYYHPGGSKLLISPEQSFLKIYFSPEEMRRGEDYGGEKISKIKPTRVLF